MKDIVLEKLWGSLETFVQKNCRRLIRARDYLGPMFGTSCYRFVRDIVLDNLSEICSRHCLGTLVRD